MDKDRKLADLLKKQIEKYGSENRILEFKSNYLAPERLGKYISALSNAACLDNAEFAYLYFGVEDGSLDVKGTTFDPSRERVKGQPLEMFLRQNTSPKISFSIDEFMYEGGKRIVVIRIPAAVSEPTRFQSHSYIRVDSSLTELAKYPDWVRAIYNSKVDWTAQIVEDASIGDLDADALDLARKGYKQRFPDYALELERWDDAVFLDKANLTQDGKITRAALLLLGKKEKAYKLGHIAQMVWKCFQDGETFGDIYTIPFLTSCTELFSRIRNYRFKIFPENKLIPAEVWKYDVKNIHEGLHNCIAHQDYSRDERIIVTEDKDKLTFENAGGFYEGDYEQYINGDKTPKSYRNPFLVKAMVNPSMIDTQGYGIHKMFERQKERYLPMPDYDGTTDSHVTLHLPGTVIDEDYSMALLSRHDLSLTEVVLLDRLQKRKPITADAVSLLRKKHLVEGRRPCIYIAKTVAQTTDQKVKYSLHKGLDYGNCEALLMNALRDHRVLTKAEITELLWNVLSDQLNDSQKRNKIDNILRRMREQGIIKNNVKGSKSEWSLVNHT